jgi:hypothetical protein
MIAAPKSLAEVVWTPDLVAELEAASAAIAALDASVSNSLLLRVWQTRAALSGYAAALRLQHEPLDEIDVFSHFCGIKLPGREPVETTSCEQPKFAPGQ